MIIELNAEEIRQIAHGHNTNPEIPVRVYWECQRFLGHADGSIPPDEELPDMYRDYGLNADIEWRYPGRPVESSAARRFRKDERA